MVNAIIRGYKYILMMLQEMGNDNVRGLSYPWVLLPFIPRRVFLVQLEI